MFWWFWLEDLSDLLLTTVLSKQEERNLRISRELNVKPTETLDQMSVGASLNPQQPGSSLVTCLEAVPRLLLVTLKALTLIATSPSQNKNSAVLEPFSR